MKMIDPRERQPADGELVLAVRRTSPYIGSTVLVLYEDGKWLLMPVRQEMGLDNFYWLEEV